MLALARSRPSHRHICRSCWLLQQHRSVSVHESWVDVVEREVAKPYFAEHLRPFLQPVAFDAQFAAIDAAVAAAASRGGSAGSSSGGGPKSKRARSS